MHFFNLIPAGFTPVYSTTPIQTFSAGSLPCAVFGIKREKVCVGCVEHTDCIALRYGFKNAMEPSFQTYQSSLQGNKLFSFFLHFFPLTPNLLTVVGQVCCRFKPNLTASVFCLSAMAVSLNGY